jgi:hypothetical protein
LSEMGATPRTFTRRRWATGRKLLSNWRQRRTSPMRLVIDRAVLHVRSAHVSLWLPLGSVIVLEEQATGFPWCMLMIRLLSLWQRDCMRWCQGGNSSRINTLAHTCAHTHTHTTHTHIRMHARSHAFTADTGGHAAGSGRRVPCATIVGTWTYA